MASTKTRRRLDPRLVRHCVTYKVSYGTKSEALDACERAMDLGLVMEGCHLCPYSCEECGRWHITNRVIVQLGARRRTIFQGQST